LTAGIDNCFDGFILESALRDLRRAKPMASTHT
jgi:hypothetical protein